MKVALVHDWLVGFRGGERVLEALCEMYPEADIYTLLHDKGSTSAVIESRKIHTSFLNKVPDVATSYRNFLPLFPLAIRNLKIPSDIDLVISTSHCVAKGIKIPTNAKHISYVHSPMRYIYDQFDSYFGSTAFYKRIIAHIIRPYLQTWDFISNKSVDHMISNSKFVASRIKAFYNLNSEVIYPFVDLKDFRDLQGKFSNKSDYYLMVTALAPNKRVDLAVEAFKKIDRRLIVIGTGQDGEELKKNTYSNISFIGSQSREKIIQMMREARGFVFPGIEDFGITPLESLASGTAIIAYSAGGVLETLTQEVAEYFYEPTPESLIEAIYRFEKRSFQQKLLFDRAELFSKEQFKAAIERSVSRHSY